MWLRNWILFERVQHCLGAPLRWRPGVNCPCCPLPVGGTELQYTNNHLHAWNPSWWITLQSASLGGSNTLFFVTIGCYCFTNLGFFFRQTICNTIWKLISLVPRPLPFFVLRFSFSIIHGSSSASVYYTEQKTKNKKTGEAWERG